MPSIENPKDTYRDFLSLALVNEVTSHSRWNRDPDINAQSNRVHTNAEPTVRIVEGLERGRVYDVNWRIS